MRRASFRSCGRASRWGLLGLMVAGLSAGEAAAPTAVEKPAAVRPAAAATVAAPAAPAAATKPGPTATDPNAQRPRPPFNRPPREDQRRDVFYDLTKMIAARQRIEQLMKAPKPGTTTTEPGKQGPKPENELQAAEQNAKQVLAQIKDSFNERQWDQVLRYIDRNYEEIRLAQERFPDSKVLNSSLTLIKNYRLQAAEKKLYEEARAQFLALGLRVDGIIWSADQPSLAVIRGEPKAVAINDRVKDCVVVGIDTNRVDFMFPFRRRKFHFQRYIGDDN